MARFTLDQAGVPNPDALVEEILPGYQASSEDQHKNGPIQKSIGALQALSGKLSVADAMQRLIAGCAIKFIMVIGLTGAGKSTMIKTLTGEEVYVEHSINTGTTSFEMIPTTINGQSIVFIDTPGFNDPNRSDIVIFREILGWFESMSAYCHLSGILYVHDISTRRFTGAARLNLDMLEALCGPEFYSQVSIVTTMWGDLTAAAKTSAEERQEEFEGGPWKNLIDGGTRVFQHREAVVAGEYPQERVLELRLQQQKAKDELLGIMSHYLERPSSSIPMIQSEVRREIPILETQAGRVLVDSYRRRDHPVTRIEDIPNEQFQSESKGFSSLLKAVGYYITAGLFTPPLIVATAALEIATGTLEGIGKGAGFVREGLQSVRTTLLDRMRRWSRQRGNGNGA